MLKTTQLYILAFCFILIGLTANMCHSAEFNLQDRTLTIDAMRFSGAYYNLEMKLIDNPESLQFKLANIQATSLANKLSEDGAFYSESQLLKLNAVNYSDLYFSLILKLDIIDNEVVFTLTQAFAIDKDIHTGLSFLTLPDGSFSMGEEQVDYQGDPETYDSTPHSVNLSSFLMSETEISNLQYVNFLNSADLSGLIEVRVEDKEIRDLGKTLVYWSTTASDPFAGEPLLSLDGIRVLKDHDNADGDNDPFTGTVEPENPLNMIYIGYDETKATGEKFYVKDPQNIDWKSAADYCDYTSQTHEIDTNACHNDYENWVELQQDKLPALAEVKQWPATFIRWHGAKAYALFYQLDLPTEAQWEYAAKAGNNYTYATADGSVAGDGSSANWNFNQLSPAQGHVLDVRKHLPNPFGIYTMAGNAWEWVEDWYGSDFYSQSGSENPVNTDHSSGLKVRRGGSWNYHQATLKSASRFSDEVFKANDHFGFRVIKIKQ